VLNWLLSLSVFRNYNKYVLNTVEIVVKKFLVRQKLKGRHCERVQRTWQSLLKSFNCNDLKGLKEIATAPYRGFAMMVFFPFARVTRMNQILSYFFAILIFVIIPHNAYAQNTDFKFDRTKPIEVTADSLVVSDDKKTGEFLGNVQITQGTYKLTSNRIIIEYSNKEKQSDIVTNMTAFGDVYLFNDNHQAAKAEKMVYNLQTKILILSGNVLLNYDKNILRGNEITVNTQTKYIKVTGTKKQRVNAVLTIPE
jgi:lipopolysaccharide export system protein LptA